MFSDWSTHNLGTPQFGPGLTDADIMDRGREGVSGNPDDAYAFRTPSLRNVEVNVAYMHNGVYTRIEDVIRHQADPEAALLGFSGQDILPTVVPSPYNAVQGQALASLNYADILLTLDPKVSTPRSLTDAQIREITDFLMTLTDPAIQRTNRHIPASVPSGRMGAL